MNAAVRWASAAGLAVLVGALALLAASTGAVTPVAVTVVCLMVVVHAQRLGWRIATALTLLVVLVAQVLFSYVAPHTGGTYGADMMVVWTVVGCVYALLLAVLTAPGGHVDRPARWDRTRTADLACALAVPAALTAYFWWANRREGPPWIGWAMAQDSANNIILNREFLDEGGLLRSQGNAAPLSTVLNSAWGAAGFEDLSYAEQVRHLILSGAQFSLVLGLLLSFLAAVLTLASARGDRGSRLMWAIAAGALPWTWFVVGYALLYGYQNALPGMLSLVLGWMCWMEHRRQPVASLTGQVLATWVAGMAWGPVAIVPAVWLVATAVVERRALRRAGWRLLWPGLSLVSAVAYAYLVTLRDVSAQSGALAFDGAVPPVDRYWAIGTAAAVLVVSLVCFRWISPTVRVGAWVAIPAAALGAYYLVRQRTAVGALEWWGYYPVKFSWIVLCALFLVAVSSVQHPARRVARWWLGNGAVLGAVAVILTMVQVSGPFPPLTVAGVAAPVRLHDETSVDAPVDDMIGFLETNPRSIVSRYFPPPGGISHDSFVNFWMLQMSATSMQDPIRDSAYTMNSDDPGAVCQAIAAWQGEATVWTRDPKLERQLGKLCDPAFAYDVVLRPAVPASG